MIRFSYHNRCHGKPEKRNGFLWQGEERINLGYGWITAELEFEEIYELISAGGAAFGPALSSEHRNADNFVSHQIALVDIDDGMTIDQLRQHPFYQLYGSGFYTTPSHTDENPRFRVIYRLDFPVTDTETMRIIYEGLLAIHGYADISCKDPARLFYGSVDAEHREIRPNSIGEEAFEIVVAARDLVNDRKPVTEIEDLPETDITNISTEDYQTLILALDTISRASPRLEYSVWCNVSWAVLHTVGPVSARQILLRYWREEEPDEYRSKIFASYRAERSPDIRYLFNLAKTFEPKFWLKTDRDESAKLREIMQKKKGKLNGNS